MKVFSSFQKGFEDYQSKRCNVAWDGFMYVMNKE